MTPDAYARLPRFGGLDGAAGTPVGPHGLTPQQVRILELIGEGVARGRPPTIREIGDACGIRSPNGVVFHLRALAKKGVIRLLGPGTHAGSTARGIEIVGLSDIVAAIVRRHVRTLTHGDEQ